MIRGVVFDMDGLMTDTEGLFLRFWCQVMEEMGYPPHRELVIHCAGLNLPAIDAYVAEKLGPDFPYRQVLLAASARSRAYCDTYGVPVKPGLYPLLDELDRRKIPYGVATSAPWDLARDRLESIGVLSRLSRLVTGDMTDRGKPAPDLYLLAADKLRLPPEDCLALEDSPHGIMAAHLAGFKPVMVPDLAEPPEEILPLLYGNVRRLDQVTSLL